ncbi:hypothetical protein VTN96DRAFT_585 [Rasamsonia emersonii]|uniref:Transcription factor TFIIIC triple barrel domain-containing protein n=1 Tax=Rasamsonia emersonii (strain ATCC 16479 / CBS 393.64 / IMI 116815) TaxID=1408163 RepID=A0A0F4YX12_RASE3|nr:hypothetical protein T310_3597 [Rasamsonia emersonii CBS 393.64]KKA22391.1 hypothetical protein T310_3597 [Rasamsonia emersonii CBS 393.64]
MSMQVDSDASSARAVDPALLSGPDADDFDYEYEYDENETETFYINLDITTLNGPIRPPRRRQPPSTAATSPHVPSSTIGSPESPPDETNGASIDQPPDAVAEDRIQILDLHSPNPLISYQNHIFSCSWADVIGTELFFSKPEPEPEHAGLTCLRHGKDFDLIAANSVKIVGRKAHLISNSGPREDDTSVHPQQQQQQQQGLQVFPASHAKRTSQARFLQRLVNAKQSKGETDMVRTVYSVKRGQHFEDRLRGWARTEERMARIQRLSRDALQGDADAIRELQEIYAEVEAAADSSNAGPAAAGPAHEDASPHQPET